MEKNNRLLIVDDEEKILSALKRLLQKEGYEIFTARSGQEGLDILHREIVGVVVSDLMMPAMDGIEFLGEAALVNPDLVKLLLTGHASLDTAIEAINRLGLFGFIVKPWNNLVLTSDIHRAFVRYNLAADNKRLFAVTQKQNRKLEKINASLEETVKDRTRLLDEAIEECIMMMERAAQPKDDAPEGHVHRIYNQVLELCKALGLPEEETKRISRFSMVHDIGKLTISDDLLFKSSGLTEKEKAIKRSHTTAGEAMLGVKPFYQTAREIARSHHEKWDGSGYPDGLRGEEIPLPARIVAVVDTFEALSSQKPPGEDRDRAGVLAEMKNIAGSRLDPRLVETFLAVQESKRSPTR